MAYVVIISSFTLGLALDSLPVAPHLQVSVSHRHSRDAPWKSGMNKVCMAPTLPVKHPTMRLKDSYGPR